MSKLIAKEDIKDLLKELAVEWDVYVPQKKDGQDIWFEVLPRDKSDMDKSLNNVALGDEDIVISPKDIFFPQVEQMFGFKGKDIKETAEHSPKLLFGIKPCDLAGILFVDDFFKRNIEDKYYLSRSKDRLIVTIGCLKPPRPNACFCTSAQTGPFAEAGYDLQLVDNEDSYYVEVGSEKGKEFVAKYEKFFKDSKENNAINDIKIKAQEAVELKVLFKNAIELMKKPDFIPQENYERIAERCIYCGACLYTCPTCTCFNVFDNAKEGFGERCRNWDGCVFEGYTREASGHNPRKTKASRASRRYEHKLKYDYEVTGISGCIGCGRCLSSCPVNIGMSKFIQEITEKREIL